MSAPDGEPGAPATLPERLLVSLLALAAVAGPYLLRGLDDNRLTSWSWVFGAGSPAGLFALAGAAALLAHAAARLAPARHRQGVLFLCAYAAGAAFWTEPEPILDAARYFTQAKHLELYGVGAFLRGWGREIPAWTDLPLVPFLYGIVLRLSGEARLAIEAFTTLLFAGSAVLTARIGEALWDEETGLAAGAFLLASPYLVTQVPAMLVDVPTLFFLALALLASLHAMQRGGPGRVVLAGAAVFLALFAKYSAALLLSVLPVAAVVLRRAGAPRPYRALAGIAGVAGALGLALVLPQHEVYARQLSLLLGYQAPGLRRWGESFLSTFVFQVHPFLAAAVVASVFVAVRRRDARWLVAAWPVLLLVVLEVRRIRYLVPAFPMLALAGAYGLRVVRAPELRRAIVASAALSSLAVGLYGYLPFLRASSAMNLKDAGAYLDGLPEERVEVLAAWQGNPEVNPASAVPILDLFTAKQLVAVGPELPRPEGAGIDVSPLRFTWELGIPRWYARQAAGGDAVVALIWDGVTPLPAQVVARLQGLALDRTFDADEGVFRHRTQVRIYRHGVAAR
jgi:hypothetical protein